MYDQSYIFWLHLTYLFQNFAQRLPNVCPEGVQSLQINKNSNFKKLHQETSFPCNNKNNKIGQNVLKFERKLGYLAQGSGIKLHKDLKVQPFGLFSDVEAW